MSARIRLLIPLLFFIATAASAAHTVVVPAGTSIHIKLRQTINTATAKAGQHVPAALTQALVVGGKTVAASGSAATVRISEAEASGRIGGSAKLTFSLASITLANGQSVDVHTSSFSRVGRAHAKHNAKYIAGAIAGQAIGGDRDATRKGTAIGAGVGIAAAAGTGKFDFSEPAGTRFSLKLRSPIKATL